MNEASAQVAVAAGTSGQPWWAGQIQAWESEVHALLGATIPGEFIVQVGLPIDGRHLSPENLRATLAHSVAKLVEVAQRAVVAEALVKRWESEAVALLGITIPKELVVPVCEGGGPEDLRASLVVSVAKLVETLKQERRTADGQVKTLAADFRRNQDQWQEHTKKLEAERDTARGDREWMSEQLKATEATAEGRRLALQQALDESGCNGDLCAHRWHEAARTALAPVEPADGAKTCSLCAKPLTYPLVTIGDGPLIGRPGAGDREIVRGDVAHDGCYWKARFGRAETALRTYRQEARRQWETPVCAWGCEHPTGVEVMDGAPPKLDCDEATLAEAERRYTEAVKAHAMSCPKHPLAARAQAAEAEVKRVRGLIDRDRTGLATGLAAVVDVVKGYWWLADGGWGSHEDKDRTEATLREEFTNALELVSEICKRHLGQSGDRANAAFHGGDGPAESIDPGRMRLLAEAQCDEMGKLAESLRRQVKDLAEKHRGAMLTASRTAADPARTLREQIADERAALLGMFPNDLVIYAKGDTGEENARKTLASSLGALLRAFEETKAIASGLQQQMTAINDALDEFGAQHPRAPQGNYPAVHPPLVDCVREAMTTLRTSLAEVRAENGRLRKDVQALDGQAAMMRGVLEMSRDWISDFADTEPVGGAGEPCSVNIARAVVDAIGEALKAEAGESLRAREVWLLQEYAALVMRDERIPDATFCRKCQTRTLRPAPDQPYPPHRHNIRCPLFYLGDAAYQGGPKTLRRELDQQQKRAETAEAALQRLESGLEVVIKGIPDRLVQPIGGVDNLERQRSTLAVTVPHLLRELASAEARALELEAKLDMAATQAAESIARHTDQGLPFGVSDLPGLVRTAVTKAVDPEHLKVLGRLQREAQTAEDKAARARVATDEAREQQERAEARAEQVAADAAAKDKAGNQAVLYYQSALSVANALLEEGIGMGAPPHPLGLTHAQMLGEPPEVDQKEVYRLRKVLEVIAATGWWVNATVLGARRTILLAAALECEGRATRADQRFKDEMVPGRYIGEALRDISQRFGTQAVEEPSADERRRLAEVGYQGSAGGGKTAALDAVAREAQARGEVVVRVGPGGGEDQK